MSRALSLVVLVSVLGCGEPAPEPPFPVLFEAVEGPGAPLGGVTLSAAGGPVGSTDGEGRLAVELYGVEGATVPIEVACPTGHRAALAVPPLILRRTLDLTTGAPAVLRVSVTCPPEMRHGVVVLRAGGGGNREGIPVMVDGVEVARTDRSGVAHVALDRPPGTTVSVMLATSTVMPGVTPRDPAMPFTFADSDQIFFFDRPLTDPPPAAVERRGGHRGPRVEETTTTRGGPCNLRTGVGCH